jgi:hypothetical protein
MHKILILNNTDLSKALEQAIALLPDCKVVNIKEPMADDATIIIGDIADLQEFINKNRRLIGFVDNANTGAHTAGITIIKKPYRLKELIDVIQNILSNILASSQIVEIGNFKFDPIARTMVTDKIEIILTEKESEIITLLNNAGGEVLAREDILKEIWGYDSGIDTHTVETHIYRIRQKLGKENDFISSNSSGYLIISCNQNT